MTSSIALRFKWTEQTAATLGPGGFNIRWDEKELLEVRCPEPPLTIDDISTWIQARLEGIYSQMTGGADEAQAQVTSIRRAAAQNITLPWDDRADQHLKNGDMIVVDCQMESCMMAAYEPREYSEEELKAIRAGLRFDLNDRLVCFCGPRWFSGVVVGTAVVDEGEVLPYLVKTDPLPGLPGRTISVPSDENGICTQEVCFHPHFQLHLIQAAALVIKESARPKLRFTVGDSVVVRISNSAEDGLEQWVEGKVGSTWPKITKQPEKWEIAGIAGVFPDAVPYKVEFSDGTWLFCHRDSYTLIRRAGMQPRTRVKGISKRMEVLQAEDGSREQIDYHTERRQRMWGEFADEDSD